MPRPNTIRCKIPITLQLFLKEELDDPKYKCNLELMEFINHNGYEWPRWQDAPVDEQNIEIPNGFIDLPPNEKEIYDIYLSKIKGYSIDMLNSLQKIVREAVKDVERFKFYADISETHLPALRKLAHNSFLEIRTVKYHYWYPEFYNSKTSYKHIDDAIIPWEHYFYEKPRRHRNVLTHAIPYPYGSIFGVVCLDALEWLNDLEEHRCFVCGTSIGNIANLNRRYCSDSCKQRFYRIRNR